MCRAPFCRLMRPDQRQGLGNSRGEGEAREASVHLDWKRRLPMRGLHSQTPFCRHEMTDQRKGKGEERVTRPRTKASRPKRSWRTSRNNIRAVRFFATTVCSVSLSLLLPMRYLPRRRRRRCRPCRCCRPRLPLLVLYKLSHGLLFLLLLILLATIDLLES